MKTYRARTGPFPERPYYEAQDIEDICTDELRKAGLYPSDPTPIRIERFIEKRFGITPVYDDLPKGLLGFTKFGPQGLEDIVLSRALAEEQSKVAERRINTTLAHEAGHGLLHAHLFVLGTPPKSLFGDGVDEQVPKILCRNDAIPGVWTPKETSYDGRWWEYQANRAIGALLLPRALVDKALDKLLVARGLFGRKVLEAHRREKAEQLLAEVFDVNPVVARIRIGEAYPESDEAQLTL